MGFDLAGITWSGVSYPSRFFAKGWEANNQRTAGWPSQVSVQERTRTQGTGRHGGVE